VGDNGAIHAVYQHQLLRNHLLREILQILFHQSKQKNIGNS
jgi:hypothetical protein